MTSSSARRPARREVFKAIACAAIAIGLAPAAQAQERLDYAVLSLVGDQIGVVGYNPAIGSNLNRHSRRQVDLQDDSLDRAALIAVHEALKRSEPGAELALLKSRNPAHFKFEDHEFDSLRQPGGLIEALKPLVQQTNAKRLVLVTKYRAEITLAVIDGGLHRPGKLYGPGFYLDRATPMLARSSGESSIGFVAPFAYLRVSVIDVPTMAMISTATATESMLVTVANKRDAVDPWDALNSEEKVRYLQEAIRVGVDSALERQKPVR